MSQLKHEAVTIWSAGSRRRTKSRELRKQQEQFNYLVKMASKTVRGSGDR